MSREAVHQAVRDLVWSIFTELGVPGVIRHHRHVAIDPEPIVVVAPSFFDLDPRLRDQVYGWCATHADRLSVSRLRGLLRQLPAPARTAFGAFAATLSAHAGLRWPTAGVEPWTYAPAVKPPGLPVHRPALVRLRLRALSGVGARADVLAELIARSASWTRASDLADEGYSKRAIAGVLSELSAAGMTSQASERNAIIYRLCRPDLLRDLAGANALAFPSWRMLMVVVLMLMVLTRLQGRADAVKRVEANKLNDALRPLCARLGLVMAPATRGNPRAWEDMMSWAALVSGQFAERVGRTAPDPLGGQAW